MENQLSKDVEDLKASIDQIFTETALNSARIDTLQSTLLGVFKETLPAEAYKNLCANYLSELKQRTDEALDGLDKVLFEPEGKVLKLKADNHLWVGAIRRKFGVDI
jgi:chromosome segregation ATPase